MSKNQPLHASTIINQDEVNNAYAKEVLPKQPDKPVHPLSLAAWLKRADKTIYLKWVRGGDKNKELAKMG